MLNIPSNEKNTISVVSETYDLLKPTEAMWQHGDEFFLFRPSSTAPLRSMKVRSFKPIYKKSVENAEPMKCEISIEPYVFKIDTLRDASPTDHPDWVLALKNDNMYIPITKASYTVEFNGNTDDFINSINGAFSSYANELDWDSVMTYSNSSYENPISLVTQSGISTMRTYFKSIYPNISTPYVTLLNDTLTLNQIVFNLNNQYAVLFVVDFYTVPIDSIYTSRYQEIFNAQARLAVGWDVPNNDCIIKSARYDEIAFSVNQRYYGVTLTLTSPFMGNLTQKIYTGFTEATVDFKRMDTVPSENYLPVSIVDNNNQRLLPDYLDDIYDQIIIEIDYIYETVA